ncbi:protein toll-like [Microplitis mediator]|uniref:protein toll-like n=1 Tax=Microplitis mediator TaxID=375433 RepID=UPI002552A87E|nr:protein toll-like [Microplitis mediator]
MDKFLIYLLFITTAWAAQCPGSNKCENYEIVSNDTHEIYYGIIDKKKLFSILLEDVSDSVISSKFLSNWPQLLDMTYSPKNKNNLNVNFLQCKFPEKTDVSNAVRRIYKHVNITKLVIQSSSFGDGFASLSKGYLKDFISLRRISLIDNIMENIGNDFFEGFSNLEYLSLRNNQLKKIPSKLLEPLSNLKQVDLSDNDFSTLSPTLLRNNTKLESFELSNNAQFLPLLPNKFFVNLKNLKEVKITNSHVMQLPDDLFLGTTGLKNLNLSANHLFYIPRELFGDCKNLKTLDLSSNHFSNDLFFSDNAFTSLNKLENLYLSNNNITSLSSNLLAGLSSLNFLDMSHNDMITIDPRAFYNLGSLKYLDFSNNVLTLKSDSYIDEFGPISPFHHIKKSVREINLAYNNISEIFGDWILAADIRILNLSHNYVNSLKTADLQFVSRDVYLDLSFNKIEQIYFGEVEISDEDHPKYLIVDIEYNPLICDCNMYSTLQFLDNKMPFATVLFELAIDKLKCNGKVSPPKTYACEFQEILLDDEIGMCPENCSCKVRPADQRFLVDCSYRELTEAPSVINWFLSADIEVNLTGNHLTRIPFKNQTGYDQVTVLSLSHNKISEIPINMSFNYLEELYLDNNDITKIDDEVLEILQASKHLRNLTLHNNKLAFDCDSSNLLTFIQNMQVKIPELQKITYGHNEIPISEITPEELCSLNLEWVIYVCMVIAIVGIIIGSLFVWYCHHEHEIKVWLYAHEWCLGFVTEEELDKDKIFDAFISFSHKDEEFIAYELVPKLRQGPNPLKLCVNYHSWVAGEWVPQQISKSVDQSRRIIIVLSPNYLDSIWGKLEFRAAHNRALDEGRARVIVILYGGIQPSDIADPELKAYLNMNTYVQWEDPWFWDKLRYALPHSKNLVKKNKTVFKTQRPTLQIKNDNTSKLLTEKIEKSTPDILVI